MGINSRRRKEELESRRISRRRVLVASGLSVLLAGVGVGVPLILSEEEASHEDPRWGFLTVEQRPGFVHLDENLHLTAMKDRFVPLSPVVLYPVNSPQHKRIIRDFDPKIREEITKRRWNKKDIFRAEATTQYFGAPENPEITEQTESYLRTAYDFMNSRIRGLSGVTINWTQIKSGDDYSSDSAGRCFICKGSYQRTQVTVTGKNDSSRKFSFEQVIPSRGGLGVMSLRGAKTTPDFTLFISANHRALHAIFSETFPISTYSRDIEYLREKGFEKNVLLNRISEGLAEGLAYHLGLEISDKLNIPGGREIIEQVSAGLSMRPEIYGLVPQSKAWIAANGVQNAFDLYMEDPDKFHKAITRQS